MARNFDLIAEMGGPEEARRLALALEGREAKMIFMRRFWGVGDKYARDIWMSAHDPDFRDAIAVDDRIKKVTRALGYSFRTYEEHERFYQDIAAEAGLQPWEADRLLYEYQKVFLAAIQAGEKVRQTSGGEVVDLGTGDEETPQPLEDDGEETAALPTHGVVPPGRLRLANEEDRETFAAAERLVRRYWRRGRDSKS
jgi:hypothetical protein